MKKKLLAIVLALVAVFSVFVVTSCNKEKKTEVTYLADYMAKLSAAGELVYEASEGQYGLFITSVEGEAARNNSQSWSIYTSNEEYNGEYGKPYTYNGTTLYTSSKGASELPVKSGETVMFILLEYDANYNATPVVEDGEEIKTVIVIQSKYLK